MEYVASEYVLDFELERPSSTASLEMYFAGESKIVSSFVYGNNSKKFLECFLTRSL